MKDLDVNLAIWESFTNTTLRAAVHLGKDYDLNSRYVKNHLWKTARQLFIETEKLVSRQTETAGISVIDFQDSRWMSTSLLHNRAYQYSTAKASVFSQLYSVWERWETILLYPGRSKSNGIRTIIVSAN